jgi:ABC-type branched-subunit amino acid transport system ATPase component/ABC-type branched-subunit amino acid transport system permease subunit
VSDPATLAKSPLVRAAAAVLAAVVVVGVLPFVLDSYLLGVGSTVGIHALLALGLILVTGYAGQFSLAQAAFFGIGAYGSGLLTTEVGLPAGLALVATAAIATALAYALGKPIFRLRGHFLAMGTLALTAIFFTLANNVGFAGGSSGFGGIEPFSLFGIELSTLRSQFWAIWAVLGVALWCSLRIRASREGRALRALKGHEAAAASCGVNIAWSKTRIFAGSAFLGSIAGSFYAHQILYVNPPPFDVIVSIDILAIAVLGGLLSPWGAVVGAVSFEVIREAISQVLPGVFGAASVGAGETLVFGVILVGVLVLRPDGLVGAAGALAGLVARRVRRSAPDRSHDEPGDLPADEPPGAASDPDDADRHRPREQVLLEACGLTKHFGGVRAVDDVDLVLHEREILAVIGPNGAGKTTLLNLLSGNLVPTSGTVVLAGTDVTGAPAHVVAARGLSRTFQTPSLFTGMTTRDNVLVGSYLSGRVGLVRGSIPTPGAVREERRLGARVDRILDELGMRHLAERQAAELSLGQQKMVEVARALAHEPSVLLLDEPGAGLNRAEKLALAATLRALRGRGVSLLLIEHDMEFVMSLADRVHVLDFGRTLRVGSPRDVQADEAVIAAYLGTGHDGDGRDGDDPAEVETSHASA